MGNNELKTTLRLDTKQFQDGMKMSKQEMKRLSDEAKGLSGNFKSLKDSIGDASKSLLQGNFKGAGSALKGITSGAGMATMAVGGLAAGFAIAGAAFKGIMDKNAEFEQKLANLRALTGLSADEMGYFAEKAKQMGGSSTQTASEVVDAFKLIGSQAPELLKSKEALAEVTENAIILSEASQISLEDAAKGITTAVNGMGMSVTESSRIINVLAAASQAGAGDVTYLNQALEKSGSVAAQFGVKFETSVAAVEVLAEKISDASTAGTNFRNILINLETQGNGKFKPSVVGMETALSNLKKANLDATAQTKLFGKENIVAGITLLDNIDKLRNYEKQITGTNTALEQQEINNDTLIGATKNLTTAWEAFQLSFNNSTGIFKKLVDYLTSFIESLDKYTASDATKQQRAIITANEGIIKSTKERIAEEIKLGKTEEEAYKKTKKNTEDELNAKLKLKKAEREVAYGEKLKAQTQQYKPHVERDYKRGIPSVKGRNIKRAQDKIDPLESEIAILESQLNTIQNTTQESLLGKKPDKTKKDEPKKDPKAFYKDNAQLKTKEEEAKWLEKNKEPVRYTAMTTLEKPDVSKLQIDVDPIEIPVELKGVEKVMEDAAKMQNALNAENESKRLMDLSEGYDAIGYSVSAIGGGLGALTGRIDEAAGAWVNFAVEMIAQIPGIISMALALQAGLPFPANLVAISTTLGSVLGAMASIPAFATGGIVQGGTYSGDKIPALLNAGEMVLNTRQQSHLFNQLDRPTSAAGASQTQQVEFKIKGDYLVGMINKHQKRTSRV